MGPSRSHRGWPATAGLLFLCWALLCTAVVGVGWLLTHPLTGSVGKADDQLARWIAAQRTPTLDDVATVGAFVGDTLAGQIGLVAIAVGFSVWQRSPLPAVFLGIVEAGLLGIYLVAGNLIPRDRPPVRVLDPGLVPDHSFPSGHVATATAIYGTLVVLTWTYGRRYRWMAVLFLMPVVALVSRLYQGAHHLSDVLTSLVYAPLWVAAVTFLVLWSRAAPGPGMSLSPGAQARRAPVRPRRAGSALSSRTAPTPAPELRRRP